MTSQSQSEAAAELHRHRHDEGEWADEPERVEVRARRTEVVSFRLPSEELDKLEEAAQAAGESLSEFVRGAVALRVHGEPVGPAVEIMSQDGGLILRSHLIPSGHSEASEAEIEGFVPDYPLRRPSADAGPNRALE